MKRGRHGGRESSQVPGFISQRQHIKQPWASRMKYNEKKSKRCRKRRQKVRGFEEANGLLFIENH